MNERGQRNPGFQLLISVGVQRCVILSGVRTTITTELGVGALERPLRTDHGFRRRLCVLLTIYGQDGSGTSSHTIDTYPFFFLFSLHGLMRARAGGARREPCFLGMLCR